MITRWYTSDHRRFAHSITRRRDLASRDNRQIPISLIADASGTYNNFLCQGRTCADHLRAKSRLRERLGHRVRNWSFSSLREGVRLSKCTIALICCSIDGCSIILLGFYYKISLNFGLLIGVLLREFLTSSWCASGSESGYS